jgi:hypothetical protein
MQGDFARNTADANKDCPRNAFSQTKPISSAGLKLGQAQDIAIGSLNQKSPHSVRGTIRDNRDATSAANLF